MNLKRNWGGRTLAVKAEQKCIHIFGNEGRSEMWNYRSFAVKAEGKCGGGTTHIWQWRQSVSGEADLQIFGSQDWAKVQKRNCKALVVQAEMKCGSGTSHLSHLLKSWQNKCGKRNFRSLPVKTERKCGSRTSHIWQSRQSRSAEAELHIFGSQCRTKVRPWNFRSLAVKAERKCGSGTSGLWQLRQSISVEAEFQISSRQDRAAVKHFDSPVKLDVRKQILTALTGPYSTDWLIVTANVEEYHYWLLYWKTMWRPCVAKTHDFRTARDKVNMLLQGLLVILDWTLS